VPAVFRRGSFGPTRRRSASRCISCTASLAADPLRPSAGGASPPESRPLTPRVAVWVRRGLSRPTPAPRFARLAPGQRGTPHRQGHPHPRLFKARTSRRPETPSIGSGPRPCDRGGRLHANWFVCVPSPGTLSRAAMGSAAVRGGGSPPHATPPVPGRLSTPARLAGEMLLTDFCNRRATRAPVGFLDSRGDRRACALLTASDGAEPQRTARVKTCLTARHELQPLRCTRLAGPVSACAHAGRRLRMPPDPAGLPIVSSPRDGTPRPRRCLPWDGPNVTAFDTLVATRVRRSAAHAARTAFTMASSKAMAGSDPRRLPSPSASLDHPACAERSRTRDPPPIPRLCRPGPASGAPSPPAPEGGGARPCRFRTLITSGRTWPRAARRLLQSK
jgi:hypothetical protein